MTLARVVLVIALVGFVALTLQVLTQHGYAEFFVLVNANAATRLLFVDLVLCLTMIAVWMARDARERGISSWPFLLIAVTFGAAGPLLYLLRRPSEPRRSA